jgi:hypothetical protein
MQLRYKDNTVYTTSGHIIDDNVLDYPNWLRNFQFLLYINAENFVAQSNWYNQFKTELKPTDIVLPSFAVNSDVMHFIANREFRVSSDVNVYNKYLSYVIQIEKQQINATKKVATYKHNLLPIEFEEDDTDCAHDEQILNRVTFFEDFYHIKKGDYYHSIYISYDLGYIALQKYDTDDDDSHEFFYVQFKILNLK